MLSFLRYFPRNMGDGLTATGHLDQLAKVEPQLAELVDSKFFCGSSFAETAALQ
jgi:hypothetical protein